MTSRTFAPWGVVYALLKKYYPTRLRRTPPPRDFIDRTWDLGTLRPGNPVRVLKGNNLFSGVHTVDLLSDSLDGSWGPQGVGREGATNQGLPKHVLESFSTRLRVPDQWESGRVYTSDVCPSLKVYLESSWSV